MHYQQHPSEEVRHALLRLMDQLCQWERATGIQTVFIVRDDRGFELRYAMNSPSIPANIPDEDLWLQVTPRALANVNRCTNC